jgi:hypothetical protein
LPEAPTNSPTEPDADDDVVVVVVVVGADVVVVEVVVGGVVVVVVAGAVVVSFEGTPVQVVPFSAKLAGTGLAEVQEPLNPNDVVPPAGIAAFQPTSLTLTAVPDCVNVPFHNWLIACPGANVQVKVQPATASPTLVIVTFAPKPPCHWLDTA